MFVSSIVFVVFFGLVSAEPWWDYSAAEKERVLGPYAAANVGLDFPCKDVGPSPTVPTSVHKLRPADIKYVGAIGDSLTAASGGDAGTIFGMLTNFRGVAWSIGGQDTLDKTITLPNILRKYNSNLSGFSTGNGNQNSTNARFNVAIPGAVSSAMPAQADMLVSRMRSTLGDDTFNNNWKLITLFIGGNDLCDYCNDEAYYSVDNYRANIKGALDIFYAKMPRTLVNLVTVLNVVELEDLHEGFICQNVQGFLCDCALDKTAATRAKMIQAVANYQAATSALVKTGIYDARDDFTVVLQPFMEHMTVPRTPSGDPDFSYFAPDCFHFSKKGHAAAAIELWNNMMQPVGKKTTLWNLADTLHCPSSTDGFIYTNKNSA